MPKYYGVRTGRVPGVYTSWSECEKQVKGFPGAEYKSFGSENEAIAYVGKGAVDTQAPQAKQTVGDSKIAELALNADRCLTYLKDNKLINANQYEYIRDAVHSNIDYAKAKAASELQSDSDIPYNELLRGGGKTESERQDLGIPYNELLRDGHKTDDHGVVIYVDGSYNDNTKEYGYGAYIDYGDKQHVLYGRGACLEGGRNIEGEIAAATAALKYVRNDPDCQSVTIHYDCEGVRSWVDGGWKAEQLYSKNYVALVNECRLSGMSVNYSHIKSHTGELYNECVDKLARYACGIELTKAHRNLLLSTWKDVEGMPDVSKPDVPRSNRSCEIGFPQTEKQEVSAGSGYPHFG